MRELDKIAIKFAPMCIDHNLRKWIIWGNYGKTMKATA